MSRTRSAGEHNRRGRRDNIQQGPENRPEKSDLRSGDFRHIGRLRPFLSLHNLKLHLVAFL